MQSDIQSAIRKVLQTAFRTAAPMGCVLCIALAACTSVPVPAGVPVAQTDVDNGEPLRPRVLDRALHFSQFQTGQLPQLWQPWIVRKDKPLTKYRLVNDTTLNKTVLQATAIQAASGLMHTVNVDAQQYSRLRWLWKVPATIDKANVSQRATDDSPVRLIVTFDGDHDTLPLGERAKMELAELVSGQTVPYATLVYVWDNALPVGTVVHHALSQRIKYIVAASGQRNLGQWRRYTRNIAKDYQLAYGEAATKLLDIGIMTDSDNTASHAVAYYGDIDLLAD